VAGQQIMDDLSNVKWFKRDNINVTPVTVNAAETDEVTLIPQPEPVTPQRVEAGQSGIPFRRNGQ